MKTHKALPLTSQVWSVPQVGPAGSFPVCPPPCEGDAFGSSSLLCHESLHVVAVTFVSKPMTQVSPCWYLLMLLQPSRGEVGPSDQGPQRTRAVPGAARLTLGLTPGLRLVPSLQNEVTALVH